MPNWSEELTHDGSAECPVPRGLPILFHSDGEWDTCYTPECLRWEFVKTYRYDTDQMREHLMQNKVPFGLLLPAEQHWFQQQDRALCYDEFDPNGGFVSCSSIGYKSWVYRPIPEPKTFELFVNVYADGVMNFYDIDLADDLRTDAVIRTLKDTYNAETGERIATECIWESSNETTT